jgi:long-chain fatty acid transport protein
MGTAWAAGFATQQFGGEQGNVLATNPTALYYNPGAMGFSEGTGLGLYGQLAIRTATWDHPQAASDIPDPSGAQGADTGKAKLTNVFGGPAVAGTTHIGNLVIGGGFFAPFFGVTHWAKNQSFAGSMFPGAVDGPQRWFSIDGKIEVLYFTAGAAYRLGPLSIGATFNAISNTVSDYLGKSANGTPATIPQEGRSFFDVHGFDASFGAGAMLQIVPDQLFLAGSYQAQPGLGQQALNGTSNQTLFGRTTTFPVTFYQTLPDVIRGGIKLRPKGIPWEFRVFGDYTRWSKMQTQCVVIKGDPCSVVPVDGSTNPNQGAQNSMQAGVQAFFRRNWNDTYGIRAGASYWVKPEIELFVGAGYETAAVPDSTLAPDLFDANNFLGAIGGRFALTDMLFVTASYTQLEYMNRNNVGKSTLNTLPNGTQLNLPTLEEDSGGTYTQWVAVFTGNVEAIF